MNRLDYWVVIDLCIIQEIIIEAWKKLKKTLGSPMGSEANTINLSSNCPSLERVKGEEIKKYA